MHLQTKLLLNVQLDNYEIHPVSTVLMASLSDYFAVKLKLQNLTLNTLTVANRGSGYNFFQNGTSTRGTG